MLYFPNWEYSKIKENDSKIKTHLVGEGTRLYERYFIESPQLILREITLATQG